MTRFCILCLVLTMTVPAMAQTTGASGYNDFTINGGGSVAQSMVATTVGTTLSMEVSGQAGALVIGAISTAAVNSIVFAPLVNTVDIDFLTAQFFIDGTAPAAANPLNAFAVTDGGGNFTLAINGGLPAGALGAIQFGLVGPGYPGPAQTTQAHDVTVVVPACSAQATTGPTGDDMGTQVVFTAGPFPFYGVAHTDCWLQSNGNITFTASNTDFTSSEAELLSAEPRICPTWDDFSPNIAGTVTWAEAAGVVTLSWNDVPHFAAVAGDQNSFCATLDTATGIITLSHDAMGLNNGASVDQIVGISPGGNLSMPNNIDLSLITGGTPYISAGATDAIYEDFSQAAFGALFDLSNTTLTFTPGGVDPMTTVLTGPYTVN